VACKTLKNFDFAEGSFPKFSCKFCEKMYKEKGYQSEDRYLRAFLLRVE